MNFLIRQWDRWAARSPTRAFMRAERLLGSAPQRALALFAAAALGGNVEAAFKSGECYANGAGTPGDMFEAAHWYMRAAQTGHSQAQCRLAKLYLSGLPQIAPAGESLFAGREILENADYDAALLWAHPAAQAREAEAQAMLGHIFTSGPERLRDAEAALFWYKKSAVQNCPQGLLGHGIALLLRAKAADEFIYAQAELERAAKAGLPAAHYLLGYCAEGALGMAKNAAQAGEHYKIAAQAGIAAAQARLGALLIEDGNMFNGEIWLRRAALRGDCQSALSLAEIYANPRDNLPPNHTEAAHWVELAAQAGSAVAQAALGEHYVSGRGVPRDHAGAKTWLSRAADAGHAGAMFALGALHSGGYDIPADPTASRFWFGQAAEHGHGEAALMFARYLMLGLGDAPEMKAGKHWYAVAALRGIAGAEAECAMFEQVIAAEAGLARLELVSP
jgi:TPR repeat protein